MKFNKVVANVLLNIDRIVFMVYKHYDELDDCKLNIIYDIIQKELKVKRAEEYKGYTNTCKYGLKAKNTVIFLKTNHIKLNEGFSNINKLEINKYSELSDISHIIEFSDEFDTREKALVCKRYIDCYIKCQNNRAQMLELELFGE